MGLIKKLVTGGIFNAMVNVNSMGIPCYVLLVWESTVSNTLLWLLKKLCNL